MTPEIYTNGKELLFTNRRRPPAIQPLGRNQLQWCEANLKGFAWPRVQRLKETA